MRILAVQVIRRLLQGLAGVFEAEEMEGDVLVDPEQFAILQGRGLARFLDQKVVDHGVAAWCGEVLLRDEPYNPAQDTGFFHEFPKRSGFGVFSRIDVSLGKHPMAAVGGGDDQKLIPFRRLTEDDSAGMGGPGVGTWGNGVLIRVHAFWIPGFRSTKQEGSGRLRGELPLFCGIERRAGQANRRLMIFIC
jgi:hypothetical protein